MSIMLAIAGRSPVTLTDEHIPIGSDPCCAVVLDESADIKPIHAVIKEVAGRWLIEACDTDLVSVGDSEPGRRHWLKPGDVIRLSDGSPAITFEPRQPADDDFLPDVARFAESTPPARPSKPAAPLSDQELLGDTVDMTTPDTSTAIPVSKPPKSGTIRTRPPLSTEDLPVLKRNAASKPPAGKERKPGSASAETHRDSPTDVEIPVRRAKRPASSGQIPTRKPTEDEVARDLPVLSRMTSFQEEEYLPAPRRGRSSDKAEMDWIMNMILRCVGAGAALLVAWLIFSSVWKMLSQPSAGIPDLSATTEANTPTAVAAIAPVNEVPRPLPKPAAPTPNKTPAAAVQQPKPDPSPASEEPESKPNPAAIADDESDPDETDDGMMEDPNEAKLVESEDSESEPVAPGQLSPTLQAVEGSLYAVVMQDTAGTQQIPLGTAWAISDRHLVTSGAIATELKRLQKKGLIPTAMQPAKEWSMRIKNARIHSKYTKAVADAKGTQNDKQLDHIQMIQLRHDLAVLDLDDAHQMEETLPFVTKPLKTTTETVYSIVGFPPPIREGKPPAFAEVGTIQEHHSKRMSPIPKSRLKEPVINIKFPPQVQERNWSGSPVLNKDNQVIGIYAQLPPEENGAGKLEKPGYVVVWLGLLKEVTTDVFRRSDSQPLMDDDDR